MSSCPDLIMVKEIENNTGFTLIEVMIAVSILAIGLLGLSVLQISGIKNNSLAYASTQAHHLLETHMEMIIHSDYHAPGISDVSNNTGYNSISSEYKEVSLNSFTIHSDRFGTLSIHCCIYSLKVIG